MAEEQSSQGRRGRQFNAERLILLKLSLRRSLISPHPPSHNVGREIVFSSDWGLCQSAEHGNLTHMG